MGIKFVGGGVGGKDSCCEVFGGRFVNCWEFGMGKSDWLWLFVVSVFYCVRKIDDS